MVHQVRSIASSLLFGVAFAMKGFRVALHIHHSIRIVSELRPKGLMNLMGDPAVNNLPQLFDIL